MQGIALFLLGSVIGVGYRKYNLNLVDRQEAGFDNLFVYFSFWKNAFKTNLLKLKGSCYGRKIMGIHYMDNNGSSIYCNGYL